MDLDSTVMLRYALMEFRITMKLALIVEEHVNPVKHALMGFRIKMKLALTAEDHVLPVQLVPMEFAIKMKLVLTAEEPVLLVLRRVLLHVSVNQDSMRWIRLAIATTGVRSLGIVELRTLTKKESIVEAVQEQSILAHLLVLLPANVLQGIKKLMNLVIATTGVQSMVIVE